MHNLERWSAMKEPALWGESFFLLPKHVRLLNTYDIKPWKPVTSVSLLSFCRSAFTPTPFLSEVFVVRRRGEEHRIKMSSKVQNKSLSGRNAAAESMFLCFSESRFAVKESMNHNSFFLWCSYLHLMNSEPEE